MGYCCDTLMQWCCIYYVLHIYIYIIRAFLIIRCDLNVLNSDNMQYLIFMPFVLHFALLYIHVWTLTTPQHACRFSFLASDTVPYSIGHFNACDSLKQCLPEPSGNPWHPSTGQDGNGTAALQTSSHSASDQAHQGSVPWSLGSDMTLDHDPGRSEPHLWVACRVAWRGLIWPYPWVQATILSSVFSPALLQPQCRCVDRWPCEGKPSIYPLPLIGKS